MAVTNEVGQDIGVEVGREQPIGPDMMNVQFLPKIRFRNAATLAGVAIAVPRRCTLRLPIWSSVAVEAACPGRTVLPYSPGDPTRFRAELPIAARDAAGSAHVLLTAICADDPGNRMQAALPTAARAVDLTVIVRVEDTMAARAGSMVKRRASTLSRAVEIFVALDGPYSLVDFFGASLARHEGAPPHIHVAASIGAKDVVTFGDFVGFALKGFVTNLARKCKHQGHYSMWDDALASPARRQGYAMEGGGANGNG